MTEPHESSSETSASGESPVQIQATPPPLEVKKEKPAEKPRKRLTPERLAQEMVRLDRAMAVVVLLLAFFLGSFAAYNSDVWMHLAAGRMIAHGDYTFGSDPFSFTTHDTVWVNHAWLTDLLAYLASRLLGGPETAAGGAVLIALKAVLVTLLAGVMLSIRRPGQSLWLPAFCVALALVAMSPRLLLQPTCISFLFLGVTLWLLACEPRARDVQQAGDPFLRRRLIALAVLFALWVNLDSWFLLGPVLIVLFLLGEVLQETLSPIISGPDAPRPGAKQQLLVLLGVGLAACLLNPHHVRAFQVPPDLALYLSSSPLRDDGNFQALFLSPLEGDFLSKPSLGLNAAGLAYIPLVVLGLASFVVNGGGWRGWRVTVFLAFLVLSALWARSVPFFAVVAAPITALNLQDFVARRFGTEPRLERGWKNWSLIGRGATLAALVALVVVDWPGWLHGRPDLARTSHRVAWKLHVDPSLQQAADKIRSLRAAGVFRAHGFNVIPEIANYLAWFCPEEKSFFDYRTQLFGAETTQEFLDARQALAPRRRAGVAQDADRPRGQHVWQTIFRDPQHPVDHVILSSAEFEGTSQIVLQLWNNSDQWTMLYMDGRTSLFGWSDPKARDRNDALQRHAYEPNGRAFGAELAAGDMAPAEGPGPPLPRDLLDQFVTAPALRPLGVDEAFMHVQYFVYTTALQREQFRRSWEMSRELFTQAKLAGIVSVGGGAPANVDRVLQGYLLNNIERALLGQDFGSAAAPVLAVRAARRAIKANPEDADAYLALANAYMVLWKQSLEARWATGMLDELRFVQVVTALHFVLVLKPDSLDAHDMLWKIYQQDDYRKSPYLDLAVKHLGAWLEHMEALGPRSQVEQIRDMMNSRKDLLKKMEDLLRVRRETYLLKSANMSFREKLRLARESRLALQEIELWNEASAVPDAQQYNPADVTHYMRLLLKTGQYEKVRQAEVDDPLLNVLMAAAAGDYNDADRRLGGMRDNMDYERLERILYAARRQLTQAHPQASSELPILISTLTERANITVVRGLLALEHGDTAAAAKHFREALGMRLSPMHHATALAGLSAGSPLEALPVVMGGSFPVFDFAYRGIAGRYLELLEAEQAKKR